MQKTEKITAEAARDLLFSFINDPSSPAEMSDYGFMEKPEWTSRVFIEQLTEDYTYLHVRFLDTTRGDFTFDLAQCGDLIKDPDFILYDVLASVLGLDDRIPGKIFVPQQFADNAADAIGAVMDFDHAILIRNGRQFNVSIEWYERDEDNTGEIVCFAPTIEIHEGDSLFWEFSVYDMSVNPCFRNIFDYFEQEAVESLKNSLLRA